MHGANYRRGNGQPYARKKYIKGKPQIKIAKFQSGKPDNYDYCVQLLVNENVQSAHARIEATVSKARFIGSDILVLRTYPGVLLRDNKRIATAILYRLQRRETGKNFNVAEKNTHNVTDGKRANHCGNRATRGNNIL